MTQYRIIMSLNIRIGEFFFFFFHLMKIPFSDKIFSLPNFNQATPKIYPFFIKFLYSIKKILQIRGNDFILISVSLKYFISFFFFLFKQSRN